jgi:hypothetical protein
LKTTERAFVALIPIFLVLPSGCDDKRYQSRYQSVSASVTFQGAPLGEGTVEFFTTAEVPRLVAGARIVGGEFTVPADHGLPPGQYLVHISSTEITDKSGDALNSSFSVRERIPAKYNIDSNLRVEVNAGKRNVFQFDLDE